MLCIFINVSICEQMLNLQDCTRMVIINANKHDSCCLNYSCSVLYRYSAHTRMGCPYAYGQPIRVLTAHMHMGYPYARMGYPYVRMGQNSCFAHMHISAHMRIGILDHTNIVTAMM